jgi:thioredoxin reductase
MKVAIIGGGPIGMEAALYGSVAGCDVTVFERGRVADNVRSWGHVRVFTEWARNRSPLAVRLLQEAGIALPDGETTSTGDELAAYVARLAEFPALRGRVRPQSEVLALGRERALKSDFIGDPRRADRPFRLLVRAPGGEKIVHADAVIDASGVYSTPNFVGNGGMPCPGERDAARYIDYAIPDIEGRDRARFRGKATLVVGSGHSAASTLRSVGDLFAEDAGTRLVWAVRRDVPPHGDPYTLIPDDPSPHRNALHARANELARDPRVEFHPRTVVESITRDKNRCRVTLLSAGADGVARTEVLVDNIAAHTGFRPDNALYSELAVEIHAATGAPLRLGQALVEANHRQGVGLSTGYAERPLQTPDPVDSLEQKDAPDAAGQAAEQFESRGDAARQEEPEAQAVDKWRFSPGDPALLETGEPNFFVLGIKSYGRDAGFLMQNGFRQVRNAYRVLLQNPGLDLYEGALD